MKHLSLFLMLPKAYLTIKTIKTIIFSLDISVVILQAACSRLQHLLACDSDEVLHFKKRFQK